MSIDEHVGTSGKWSLLGGDGTITEIEGTFLGTASSYRPNHLPDAHPDGRTDLPPKGERSCRACRWIEFRIFREEVEGIPVDAPYLIHYTGGSSVPGETTRRWFKDELTGRSVVERLTTCRQDADGVPVAFLSAAAGRVLAVAAAFDKGELAKAYESRTVA